MTEFCTTESHDVTRCNERDVRRSKGLQSESNKLRHDSLRACPCPLDSILFAASAVSVEKSRSNAQMYPLNPNREMSSGGFTCSFSEKKPGSATLTKGLNFMKYSSFNFGSSLDHESSGSFSPLLCIAHFNGRFPRPNAGSGTNP